MKSKYLQRKINDGLGGETCVRGEGMGAEEKEKKINYSWYSVQGPGRGDFVSRFRYYHCSTVINYDSYFLVVEQFCLQILFTS